jgi:ABC-type transport system involved in multi-copper enzyme maturation permease subunit
VSVVAPVVTPVIPRLPHTGKVTQARVFRSEWTKLRSVRSTRWSLLIGIVLTIALPAIAAAFITHNWAHMGAHDRADFNPLDLGFAGVQLAQLAIGVLGVLVITAEYSTGMIRASMTAVPKRLPVLWGKAVVYGITTLVLMVPTILISFAVSQAILSRRSIDISWSHPGVTRAVIGAGLYVTVVGLFGLGLGAIIRNTAGGIAAFAGVMFVLPPLMNVLPAKWNSAASPYLPLQAGQAIMQTSSGSGHLSPWVGFLLFCVYAAAALAVAAVLLVRRDV